MNWAFFGAVIFFIVFMASFPAVLPRAQLPSRQDDQGGLGGLTGQTAGSLNCWSLDPLCHRLIQDKCQDGVSFVEASQSTSGQSGRQGPPSYPEEAPWAAWGEGLEGVEGEWV